MESKCSNITGHLAEVKTRYIYRNLHRNSNRQRRKGTGKRVSIMLLNEHMTCM